MPGEPTRICHTRNRRLPLTALRFREDPWILSQCPGAMIKQGIVSHGYQLNGELDLWHDWKARGLDKAFSRGELAVVNGPHDAEVLCRVGDRHARRYAHDA